MLASIRRLFKLSITHIKLVNNLFILRLKNNLTERRIPASLVKLNGLGSMFLQSLGKFYLLVAVGDIALRNA